MIEEKMIEAVAADAATAEQWLSQDLVREILTRLPRPMISCPQCGFPNPAGSRFCNRDGYPLNSVYKPSPRIVPQMSTLRVKRESQFSFSSVAFQVRLDGKEVSTIYRGECYTLDIQAGHHTLLVCFNVPNAGLALSDTESFDIAPGESVTFLCRVKMGWNQPSILLRKQ